MTTHVLSAVKIDSKGSSFWVRLDSSTVAGFVSGVGLFQKYRQGGKTITDST